MNINKTSTKQAMGLDNRISLFKTISNAYLRNIYLNCLNNNSRTINRDSNKVGTHLICLLDTIIELTKL